MNGLVDGFQGKIIVSLEGTVFIENHKSKGPTADRSGFFDFKPDILPR